MPAPDLPSFDLVVATVGRSEPLAELLASLERQTHRRLRVLLVDQNPDGRVEDVLARHPGLTVLRLRSARGLSRARNAALPHLRADLVAFPDDDCVYPEDLLERVGRVFASRPELDGLTGTVADAAGRSSPSWRAEPAVLEPDTLWNRAASAALFLRREVAERVGPFDERLGLGSGCPWASGEEIDYLLRALAAGARVEYDPTLVVLHPLAEHSPALGLRDGASVGYLLRKHRYPPRVVARMLARPLGGALLALARGDIALARFRAATLAGRVRGYLGASSRKSCA